MDISFNCNKCGQNIVIDGAGAGQTVECPKCGQPITVPSRAQLQSEPPITPSRSLGPHDTKKCPFCAETIKAEAIVCRYCGRDLVEKRLAEAVARKVQGPAKSDVPRSDDPEWAVELSQANTPARQTERVRVAGDVAGGSVNPPSFGVIVVLTILLPIIGLAAGIVWLCNPKYRGAGGAILAVALVLIVIYAVLFAGGC
jgi:DNA-directed RNA polymerase subunit RPC12/RpoP